MVIDYQYTFEHRCDLTLGLMHVSAYDAYARLRLKMKEVFQGVA